MVEEENCDVQECRILHIPLYQIMESLYTNILPFCGKKGHEVTRVSGLNGCTTDQMTADHFLYIDKTPRFVYTPSNILFF